MLFSPNKIGDEPDEEDGQNLEIFEDIGHNIWCHHEQNVYYNVKKKDYYFDHNLQERVCNDSDVCIIKYDLVKQELSHDILKVKECQLKSKVTCMFVNEHQQIALYG